MIEAARPADAAAIAQTLRASIGALCGADHAGDEETIARWCANKTEANMLRAIANPSAHVLVARVGMAIVGVGCWSGGEVLLNYVAPAHRFEGHSKALLRAMEQRLASDGIEVGRLSSTRTAHRFYLAMGWEDAGPPDDMFGLFGQPMEKRLR